MIRRINDFLHSEAALLVLLGFALISQVPHTATVFHRIAVQSTGIENYAAWMHASFYAVALEFATLIFVVRGQTRLAWTFAVVSVFVNFAYYAPHVKTPVDIASALLISIALPFVIATYSHNVNHYSQGALPATVQAQTTVDENALGTHEIVTLSTDATNAPSDVPSVSTVPQTGNGEALKAWHVQALQHRSEGLNAPTVAKMVGKSPKAVYELFNKYPKESVMA